MGAVPKYARSPKGQRAVIKRPSRGDNYTLILCVKNTNKQAVISYKLIENRRNKKDKKKSKDKKKIKKGTGTIDFYNFIQSLQLPTNDKHYLLLDNASIHHAPDKRKQLKLPSIQEQARQKNIVLKYLPSYTPELNPVEKCFNIIKSYYRQQRPRTKDELERVIDEAITKLQKQDLTKFFKSCFAYERWHKKR